MSARYLIITAADAVRLAATLASTTDPDLRRIANRLATDTGGDMREIAALLKHLEICAACNIEGQERTCNSLDAQKLGRRLARLIDRAEVEPALAPAPLDREAALAVASEILRSAGFVPESLAECLHGRLGEGHEPGGPHCWEELPGRVRDELTGFVEPLLSEAAK